MNEVFQHSPKQLEMIELKLEIDIEKERKSKPKHETHIMRLGTSKYMSMSRGRGAAHMAKGTREKCAARLKTKNWKVAILSQDNKKIISLLVSSNHSNQGGRDDAKSLRKACFSPIFSPKTQ